MFRLPTRRVLLSNQQSFRFSHAVINTILLVVVIAVLSNCNVAEARLLRHRKTDVGHHGYESNGSDALVTRQSYMCSKSNPCSNGACCGGSGYCGYGPTYCGTGCVSNCNATSECGQYAATPGTKCPLNTCCSEYGFCGTTTDFCGSGCQSNCVLNPQPPAGASPAGILNSRVIGYYESWSAQSSCHNVQPTDLPLDALTHINFAFAYISPGSYQIVTMDSSDPSSLFASTTNVKTINPDIKVFVSVGGWSFSDNGTDTQPLYSEIAASSASRQTFANNVVQFMRQYGFDGLDIDWEYPGAPDRGGKTEDTENYVSLLQTLRQTFDNSGGDYGLSFTAPSSYWYLRWFDLPNMVKYASWINLMSYDLHGVWDASDPIGPIVQGHTNLTEIIEAVQLFWRVNIAPQDIVLGFGFYGRSFTLDSPSCSTPGCGFSGPANAGPCSATPGILEYYEIMDILSQNSQITPTHDEDAAVMYFTFDNNQWVSYDNAATFLQKVSWADGVGLGGAMIWASDVDTSAYTAHSALLGRNIESNNNLGAQDKAIVSPNSVIQDIAAANGQNCFAYTGDCVDLNDNLAMSAACGAGFTVVGWDDAGCGTSSCHCGKPICCPLTSAPSQCIWRGNNNGAQAAGSDCSGQCAPGETNVAGIWSSWGGGFLNDGNTNKCGRGFKVFCCPNRDFAAATRGCSYSSCLSGCPSGQTALFKKNDACFIGTQYYCCPDPSELSDCSWVSGSAGYDCANAVCPSNQIEIDRASAGDTIWSCSWGRQKAACCTLHTAPPPPAVCSDDPCTIFDGYCPNNNDDESADGWSKRSIAGPWDGPNTLEKRGPLKTYPVTIRQGLQVAYTGLSYPSFGNLYKGASAIVNQVPKTVVMLSDTACAGASIIYQGVIPPGFNPAGPNQAQTEHAIDRQVWASFIQSSATGILRSGQTANLPTILNFWTNQWNAASSAVQALGAVGGPYGATPNTANLRVMEAFGSMNYRTPFLAVAAAINGAKGRIMVGKAATAIDRIASLAANAAKLDSPSQVNALLSVIKPGFATFAYLNSVDGTRAWNGALLEIRTQLIGIANVYNQPNLVAWFDLWSGDYFAYMAALARQWATDATNTAEAPFQAALQSGHQLETAATLIAALAELQVQIRTMNFPGFYGMYLPIEPGTA